MHHQETMILNNERVRIYYRLPHGRIKYFDPNLIRERKITSDNIRDIIKVEKRKEKVLHLMRQSLDPKMWRRLAKQITNYEYELQRLWRVKPNKEKHRFWELPHCLCPDEVNEELFGLGLPVLEDTCPIHGVKPLCRQYTSI